MSEYNAVWVVASEDVEKRIRSEIARAEGIRIVCFRDVCDAIEALRNGDQKPGVILGNYAAADLMLEVAHQKQRYAGIRTAYVSEIDLSGLAESHNAEFVRIGTDGKIDSLSRLI